MSSSSLSNFKCDLCDSEAEAPLGRVPTHWSKFVLQCIDNGNDRGWISSEIDLCTACTPRSGAMEYSRDRYSNILKYFFKKMGGA